MKIENEELQKAKEWWNNLPMQNLYDVNDSWAGYCMKYYPKESHCGSLNDEQILNIYKQENKNV